MKPSLPVVASVAGLVLASLAVPALTLPAAAQGVGKGRLAPIPRPPHGGQVRGRVCVPHRVRVPTPNGYEYRYVMPYGCPGAHGSYSSPPPGRR
jgi:hypothetical protein